MQPASTLRMTSNSYVFHLYKKDRLTTKQKIHKTIHYFVGNQFNKVPIFQRGKENTKEPLPSEKE